MITSPLTKSIVSPIVSRITAIAASTTAAVTANVELIINGTFDTNSDSWPTYGIQPPESITIESGQLNLAGVQHSAVAQIIPTEIGESYPIAAYVEQDGYVQVKSIDGTTIIDNLNNGADGTFSDTFVALETQTIIILALGATGLGVFDNISVKQSKLVINGGFDASLSHWINANSHWAWVSGRAYHASSSNFNTLRTLLSLEIGETYSVTFDAEHVSGGQYRCQSRDISNNSTTEFRISNDTTGTNTFAFTASEADIYIAFSRDDSGVASEFYIDNVSVVKTNNLVTNGAFDSDLSNWTDDSSGTASVSWNAAGTIQFNSTDAQNRGRASQVIQTEAGESYELTFESAANTAITIYVGTSSGASNIASQSTAPYTSTTFTFVATTSTTHLRLLGTANTNVAQADNISVVKV